MLSNESVLMRDVVWTVERTAELVAMWAKGFTGGEIALKLAPITRSAVLGKVHRMQLAPRAVELRAEVRRHRNVQRQSV
jgi:GcrA cell cycle regulator